MQDRRTAANGSDSIARPRLEATVVTLFGVIALHPEDEACPWAAESEEGEAPKVFRLETSVLRP
jgi:hypothetical protein